MRKGRCRQRSSFGFWLTELGLGRQDLVGLLLGLVLQKLEKLRGGNELKGEDESPSTAAAGQAATAGALSRRRVSVHSKGMRRQQDSSRQRGTILTHDEKPPTNLGTRTCFFSPHLGIS